MAAFFRIVRTIIACLLLLLYAGLLYVVFNEAEDWRLSFVIVLPAGVVGAAMLRGVLRERKRMAREDVDYREVAVLRLAEAEGGTLTATQVSTRMAWPVEMALATLRAVEDDGPVVSAVTDEGVLVFEFRELMHHSERLRPAADAPAAISAPAEKQAR